MSQKPLLLSDMAPNRRQVQLARTVVALLALTFVGSLPFATRQLPALDAYFPATGAVILLTDLASATLLFAQASVLRSRALAVLASGFCFSGLMAVPHALTFPGAFTPEGLLGAGINTPWWLYVFGQVGFPIAVIAYIVMRRNERPDVPGDRSFRATMVMASLGPFALVLALTLLTTVGHSVLPTAMSDSVNFSWRSDLAATILVGLLLATGLIMIQRERGSVLDLWLSITLWALMFGALFAIASPSRYCLGFYLMRGVITLSGMFVMLGLLAQTSRLYAQVVLSEVARRREREGRLLSMDAVAAAIAHEVRQPLTAIVANAGTGLHWLNREQPNIPEAAAKLQKIVVDGHRAGDVVTSIRAMFNRQMSERSLIDLNDIIRDATALIAGELRAQRVMLQLDLARKIPLVAADRVQIQQLLLNLFANSMEAMAPLNGHARLLSVRSHVDFGELFITVEDSGCGLASEDADRIFDPFFTTKTEGTGMGLTLCRSIVEAHGGRISAAAAYPQGLAIQVRLPHQGVAA